MDDLVVLKTKEERRQNIQENMVYLLTERQRLTIEYRQKVKEIDDKYSELDYKLMSGNY